MDNKSLTKRKLFDIAVLCGGDSSERPGSLLSGKTISLLLEKAGYKKVHTVDITPSNIKLLFKYRPEVAFLAFHGGFGEDGTLQGILEFLDIPYTSSGMAASCISINKYLFNRFAKSLGYAAPKQIIIYKPDEIFNLKIKYPIVLKPIAQGCSYGVFYIENYAELKKKVKFTFKFSKLAVIENYISGRELSVGIFEEPPSMQPHVLPIAETILKKPILDYEAKYPGGEHLYETIIPAKLDKKLESKIQRMCSDIFIKLDCHGFVRMDLRVARDNVIYLLENNTIPGMLGPEESDFPKMLKAGHISLEKFADMMVMAALIRHNNKSKTKVPSESEMVKHLGLKPAK